jgi:hypothetical protein
MKREARLGLHTFAVRVAASIEPREVLYIRADTVTITPAGALILAAEMPAFEDEEDQRPTGIELPPALIVAPGLWYSVLQVTDADEGHLPMFVEGGYLDTDDDDDDDDDEA